MPKQGPGAEFDLSFSAGKTHVMYSEQNAYDELRCYTLAHADPSFIHQHVVDAFTAQHADERTTSIALTFALVGLYLHVEKRFSGKQVQGAHMDLARQKRLYPTFLLPETRGSTSAVDVMAAPEGVARDQAVRAWCESVWQAFRECHQIVADLLLREGIGARPGGSVPLK